MIRHLLLLLVLAGVGCLLTAPLPWHLSTAILGAGPGDNVTGLWNVWWARTALRDHTSLLATNALYAPLGVNLVLHSLAPLVSIAAVMFTPGADAVMTYNVAMLGCVVLNLWSAYALAWRVSRDRLAAVFAAIAFAAAPILLVRTYGHLNLAAAWVLPLLLLAVVRFESSPDWRRAMVVSACLAGAAYTDYYYAIFGVIAAFIHIALWRVPISLTTCPLTRKRRIAGAIFASAIALLAAVLGWIVVTGGTTAEIAGQRLSVTGTFNLRVAIGLLAATALFVWKRPIIVHASNVTPVGRAPWRLLFVVGGLTLALTTPLLMAATSMWRAGDYISQAYVWRNAPAGVDLATAVLGNPMSPLTGGWTTALYESLGIDRVESVAWLGFAPLAMAVLALRQAAIDRRVHAYAWIGAFFFVWSLGPYLAGIRLEHGCNAPCDLGPVCASCS